MLLVPVVAVFSMVKFCVNVGLVVFAFDSNVVVKLVPFNIIDGVVNVPLGSTVMFGAVILPVKVAPNDKLALSFNVAVQSELLKVISGTLNLFCIVRPPNLSNFI